MVVLAEGARGQGMCAREGAAAWLTSPESSSFCLEMLIVLFLRDSRACCLLIAPDELS